MINLGAMYTEIKADTSGLSKAESNITAFAKRAAASLAAIVSVQQVAGFIKNITMSTARYDELGVVMEQVGKNAGYSAEQMAAYEKQVRESGISMSKSRDALVNMASAQMDLTKSSELARVAQDAAVIAQIDSSEAFKRMVTGIKAGEVEILKTMGINVSFEESYQKLASTLGKTTSELTLFEKTQARTNAVLSFGKNINGVYTASMESAGKQLRSMARYIEDASVKMGVLFQDSFAEAVKKGTEQLKGFNKTLDESNLKFWGEVLGDATFVLLNFETALDTIKSKIPSGSLWGSTVEGIEELTSAMARSIPVFGQMKIASDGVAMLKNTGVFKWLSEGFESVYTSGKKWLGNNEYIDSWRYHTVKAAEDTATAVKKSAADQQINLKTLVTEYEKYRDSVLEISEDIRTSKLGFSDEEMHLQMEISGDVEAQEIIKRRIEELKKLATEAGKAGESGWNHQIDLLEKAKSLVMEMSSESKKVSDAEVAAARQKLNIAAQAVQQHNVSSKRNIYQQALEDYNKLVNEQKNGPDEAANQEVIKGKLKEVKTINEQILEIKKQQQQAALEIANAAATSANEQGADLQLIKDSDLSDITNFYKNVEKASGDARGQQVGDVEVINQEIKKIGDVYTNVFDTAIKASTNATRKLIADAKSVASAVSSKSTVSSTPGRASGGSVMKDKLYWVGEKGRELFSPNTSGAIVPNNKISMGGPELSMAFASPSPSPSAIDRSSQGNSGATQSDAVRNYYINGNPEPVSVRSDDKNADRLMSALLKKYKGRSGSMR